MKPQIQPKLHPQWLELLQNEFAMPYFAAIKEFLVLEKQKGRVVYPPGPLIFNALDLCPPDQVKVLILGQDPYHGPGQAHGLSFSVPPNTPLPPSLQNIFKEISTDLGIPIPTDGDLSRWAKQGVLLLNTSLTVQAHQAASHSKIGWEIFTDAILRILSKHSPHLVFMLWGAHARAKKGLIDPAKHLILEAPHPSPLSVYRGFFGCKHFSQANQSLLQHDLNPISWQ